MTLTPAWDVVCLELAGDNPMIAKQIAEACTLDEIGEAWQNSRRKVEGIGYRLKQN